LIKAKGLRVYFKHSQPNDILYLKYFETYNFFLSKTFTSRHSNNSISTSFSINEINIINENGAFPTNNFQTAQFPMAEEISGEALAEKYLTRGTRLLFLPTASQPSEVLV
jgi:hypothetical protein